MGGVSAVTWWDDRDNTGEIYLLRLSAAGGKLDPPLDGRLTFNSAWSGEPSVAYNGSLIGIGFVDQRDTNTEIYFCRACYLREAGQACTTDSDCRSGVCWSNRCN